MRILIRTYGGVAACFFMLIGTWGATTNTQRPLLTSPQEQQAVNASAETPEELPAFAIPRDERGRIYRAVASADDIARYRAIALLQEKGDWNAADAMIARLQNTALVPYFLGTRYRDKRYAPSAEELSGWLEAFDDAPEASAVYARAIALYPHEAGDMKHPERTATLKGFGGAAAHAGLSLRPEDTGLWQSGFSQIARRNYADAYQTGALIAERSGGKSQHGNWLAGLAAWHLQNYSNAARRFMAMANADSETLAAPYRAAAAFWSYRALTHLGDHSGAQHYLEQAADAPTSFYGMLASAQLGRQTYRLAPLHYTALHGWESYLETPEIQQIVLLDAIGRQAEAETLLRHVFPSLRSSQRPALTALAHTLGMAGVQMAMAHHTADDAQAALYPIPDWKDRLARSSDPALVLAIVMQESGFNPQAGSPRGAQGLMQIMPATARYVRKLPGALSIQTAGLDTTGIATLPASSDLKDPAYNLAIGQAYLKHLASQPFIRGNLVYLLASYNAGAAPLLRWKASIGEDDPLLFIESISYAETRQYVKNVLKHYWIYQGLLKGSATPTSLLRLSERKWPRIAA